LQKRKAPNSLQAVATGQELQSFLNRWQDAQNKGDFPRYQDLYASRFTGIKRSGLRVYTLDRKSWLRDRQKMFRARHTVSISNVVPKIGAQSATLGFQQHWQSSSYSDQGEKVLVIVREGAHLKISREQMRSSILNMTRRTDDADIDRSAFWLVGDAGIEIPDASDPLASTQLGPYVLDFGGEGESFFMAHRTLGGEISPELSKWIGRDVKVLGSAGVCQTKIEAVRLVAGVTPHFGEVQEWEGNVEEGSKPLSKKQIAEKVFAIGETKVIGLLKSDCGGVLAMPASVPDPRNLPLIDMEPLRERALRELRKLPEYQELQREFAESNKANARVAWETIDPAPALAIKAFLDEPKHERILAIGVGAGEGCGQFRGEMLVVFKISETGDWSVVGQSTDLTMPEAAFDVSGAGDIVLVGADKVMWLSPTGSLIDEWLLSWPNQDCPC